MTAKQHILNIKLPWLYVALVLWQVFEQPTKGPLSISPSIQTKAKMVLTLD